MDLSPEFLESAFAEHWRRKHKGWTHRAKHVCSMESCDIQRIVGGVWRRGGETHICVRSLCDNHPSWANRGTLKRRVNNVYMCCATGASHWCDEQCQCTNVDCSDGGYVCMISGIRYDSVKADTWFNAHRVTATHQENKDPLKLVRDTSFTMNSASADTIRQQQHLFVSRKQIQSILFSNERLFMEQRKYVEMKREAEKIVMKYVRSCEKAKKHISIMTVVQLYINQMNRRHIFRNLLPKDRSIEEVVSQYASLTCAYWTLITRRLPLGLQTPALFPIKTFVVSILYIMKGGLSLGGVWVIPRDHYLASILPEANTLDAYGLNKPAFTACKNNILKAYREASENHRMNPHTFVLD